jgi:hypothetical protein
MHGKKFLFLAGVMALILATGTVWAIGDSAYNRPNPLMDYVPQENAILDTRYDSLEEADCRRCHGDSLADRHHYTEIVLIYNRCVDCHAVIPDPPGVVVTRDCVTSGCHSWDDVGVMDAVGTPPNGWHHNTDLSGSENCTACHDSNYVAEITPFSSFEDVVPSVVTPTPFSCENCHWDQEVVAADGGFDGTKATDHLAGHPSTFEHFDQWGNDVGYYEYDKNILSNWDNHHMGIKGNVASACYKCHANDPNSGNWDPTDPELIRYCEICHDVSTLHTIFEHVGPAGGDGTDTAVKGWVATDFHAPGSGDPVQYRSFEANEQCFACHGDQVPTINLVVSVAPAITLMDPRAGCPGGLITLTGTNFDPEGIGRIVGREVQVKISGVWTNLVSVYSWTDLQVQFEIPAWEMPPGNYRVRVWDGNRTPQANKKSNEMVLTVKDCNSPTTITPDSGPCSGTKIALENPTGVGFGVAQDTISGAGATDGVFRTIQVSASQGVNYVPLKIPTWNNAKVEFKFLDFFEDLDGDWLQDGNEPSITWCDTLGLGTYNVKIKYIFYGDSDSSAGYSDGDMTYQVESSNPLIFELTDDPFITGLNHKQLAKAPTSRLRIIGANFGPTQLPGDEVRLGSLKAYNADPFNKGKVFSVVKKWSNTKIVVKFFRGVPNAWKGKNKKVWVVKDGVASNAKKMTILP